MQSKPKRAKRKYVVLAQVEVDKVFDVLAKTWPNAHCELVHNSPFQLLVAVVLSAQATDKSVNAALEPLLKVHPQFSARDLVELGEDGFRKVIRSVGLAPTKARNCFNLSKSLVEKYKGEVPLKREQLEELPGVGRKTANVVLNVLCNEPTMPVDTHVARLSQRIGLSAPTEDRHKIELELLRKVPPRHIVRAHHYLIFHGRYHCTARAPKCESCPLLKLCPRNGLD